MINGELIADSFKHLFQDLFILKKSTFDIRDFL